MLANSTRTASSLAAVLLTLSSAGCVGLGGNVKGSFTCRAPKSDCAPSHIIDARATAELTGEADLGIAAARQRAGIADGDASRTAERTIRIVFPAHVDEAGTLHDEAVAWAVVERPQWAGQLRSELKPATLRQLRRQLRQAQRSAAPAAASEADGASAGTATTDQPMHRLEESAAPASILPSDYQLFPIASPPSLPSPADEADAGAPAPAAEGSIVPSPLRETTPRPSSIRLDYPSVEALEAAKSKMHLRKSAPPSRPKAPAPSDTSSKHEELPR